MSEEPKEQLVRGTGRIKVAIEMLIQLFCDWRKTLPEIVRKGPLWLGISIFLILAVIAFYSVSHLSTALKGHSEISQNIANPVNSPISQNNGSGSLTQNNNSLTINQTGAVNIVGSGNQVFYGDPPTITEWKTNDFRLNESDGGLYRSTFKAIISNWQQLGQFKTDILPSSNHLVKGEYNLITNSPYGDGRPAYITIWTTGKISDGDVTFTPMHK